MKIADKQFVKFMSRFDNCPFEMELNGEKYEIGYGEPHFSVIFHHMPDIKDMVTSTSIALGEAYMDGELEIKGNLYEALNSFLGQIDKFSTDHKKLKALLFSSRGKKNQRAEVSSHYDIGNDFYSMWLDDSLSYSCGYFESEKDTLHDAQYNKVDRILKKLNLREGMSLCDIGCGWGFLLIQAAKKYKVRGTGITLSEEQKKKFEERIKEEKLEDYLDVMLLDYRDLPDTGLKFDRVVSVGMVEHVGRGNYEEFMGCVKSVINKGGLFLLHYISALKEYPGDAWVKKYIFPGGVIPSLREIMHIAGDMRFYTLDVESLRRHYSRTLLCWNENFQKHKDEVREMFDERFVRMWEMYLCACAASFRNGVVDVHQILFSSDVNNEVPMNRWY